MKYKYVDFVTDDHLLNCISQLYDSYIKAKADVSKKKFFKNKIDTFKLTFDTHFNNLEENQIIESEIIRQIDKSINNSIGTFHEQVLGGITGFEQGNLSGFDIKASDNSLFADIKNKHNTMNSSAAESLFQKLAKFADTYKHAECYWVQILAKSSFNKKWVSDINGKEYSHTRVNKISGDQFYALITGQANAFFQLYKALPMVIADFLAAANHEQKNSTSSAYVEIKNNAKGQSRTILDQITFENYSYYLGFEDL